MRTLPTTAILLALALTAGCKPKSPETSSATPPAATPATSSEPTTAAAPASTATPVDSTPEQREMAVKQGKLDFASMEDRYLNDATGQWAASANASSSFGSKAGEVSASNLPANAVGPADDKEWTNDNQDMGFDWLEATFAKPVAATEVRAVLNDVGVESITKIELQDTGNAWHTVWSGLSDTKEDERGNRTWFVRKFAKTPYQVKAAKLTFANNVRNGYKTVNAVQLIGQ
jgi:hypothetical protein